MQQKQAFTSSVLALAQPNPMDWEKQALATAPADGTPGMNSEPPESQ